MIARVATALFFAACLLPGAEAGIQVAHDPEVDFSRFRTYAWNDEESLSAAIPEIQLSIVRAVERELEAKGLRKVAFADADLHVVTYAISEMLAGSMGGYYQNPAWNIAFITSDARLVAHGALVIDLRDPADGHPVWHAVAEKMLTDANKAVHTVDRMTARMFERFPPDQRGKNKKKSE